MPVEVKIGQKWSASVPSGGQWLLATVIRRGDGKAIDQFDRRYEIPHGSNEQKADETTMVENKNVFCLMGFWMIPHLAGATRCLIATEKV